MRPARFARRALAALSFTLAVPFAAAQDAPQHLSTVKLSAGMHVLTVEVARTPEERTIGLMHRKAMPTNDGMLFIFEEPAGQCFWMRNTLLPLSVAFVGDDGGIANIDDMAPETLDSHCSVRPVRYVLEMNQGWFARRGIKPGTKLRGGPFAS